LKLKSLKLDADKARILAGEDTEKTLIGGLEQKLDELPLIQITLLSCQHCVG